MSQHNEHARDPGKHSRIIAPFLKKTAPLIYLWGDTGVGKTYAIKQLIEHRLTDGTRPYAPVLYIDADNSSETVGASAHFPQLCKLKPYDGRYDSMLSWFYRQLLSAEHAKCGAIVIEGLSAIFKSMLTPKVRELESAEGQEMGKAHIEPSMRIDTAFESIKELKVNRNADGRGVPIIVTLNIREVPKSKDSNEKMFVPDFSPNRTRAAMKTSDAFLELTRESSTLMSCTRDHNKFRKLRNTQVAEKLDKCFDLSIPGLLKMWAFEKEKERRTLAKQFEELQAAPAAAPTANPETDKDTPS